MCTQKEKDWEKYQKECFYYDILMHIIDKYTRADTPKGKGLLYFLEGTVSEFAITKYKKSSGIEGFKEFFCNEVLQLHHGKRNFCEYENYFRHGNADGYVFATEFLTECMEDMEYNERGIPKILLDRLRNVAHTCLKEYFYCNKRKRIKNKELLEKKEQKKRDKYCNFVKAVGLYEIFVMNFLGNTSFEDLPAELEKFNPAMEKFQKLQELRKDGEKRLSDTEVQAVLREIDEIFRTTHDLQEAIVRAQRAVAYCSHVKYLAAFSMIIMLVEFHNVNDFSPSDKVKRTDLAVKLDAALGKEQELLYMKDVKMNKGGFYTALYEKFMEIAEQNEVIQELCSASAKVQERTLAQIQEYCYKVQKGNFQKENGEEEEDFAKTVMQIAMKCVEG